MLKIFNGSDTTVLGEWIDKCGSENSEVKLSDEQQISFLEIAEQKATAESKQEMLKDVRQKLARIHVKTGELEQAAGYLEKLYKSAQTVKEKDLILPDLVDVYLRWPNLQLATKLVENCLLEKDLGPDSLVVQSIDNYINNPPAGADPNTALNALSRIKTPRSRLLWQQRLKLWASRLGKNKEAGKPEDGGG
jgi:hypothetical protein